MAQDPITKEEVLNKFLVTSMYTVSGGWPHGKGGTVAACKIICTDEHNHEWVSHQVHRNEPNKHAEVRLIEYLTSHQLVKTSKKTIIKVYVNYSPCSECVNKILEYIEGIEEKEEREVKMTITFGNFYNTHRHDYNSQEDANANIVGLIALNAHPQVKLRLFGVHVGWEGFLGMSEFFNLTQDDMNECLDKAESPKRKTTREVQDMLVWNDIFGLEEITSKLHRSNISKLRNKVETLMEDREATGEGEEPKSLDEIFEDVIGQFAELSTTAKLKLGT